LYYYDQSGNLVKTIPPEGVRLFQVPFGGAELKNDVLRTGSVFSSITGFTGSGTVTIVPTNEEYK
jgi:hypothetical protein